MRFRDGGRSPPYKEIAMLGRAVVPAVFVAIAFAIVQSQVANLIVLPGQPDAPANNQPRAWMLVPLPKMTQPDPKVVERERWQKRAHELATLLRPFDKPHPFDGS